MKKYFKRNVRGTKNCFTIVEYILTTMSKPLILLRCKTIYATPNCYGWIYDAKNKTVGDFNITELIPMTEEEFLMEVL